MTAWSELNQSRHSQWLMTTTVPSSLSVGSRPCRGWAPSVVKNDGVACGHEELVDVPFGACRGRTGAVERDVLDAGSALAVLEVQFVRHAELLRLIGSGGRPADVDEPIGVGVRQPLEQHDLDEAEDRRARSDGSASVAMTMSVKPGARARLRAACAKSLVHFSSVDVTGEVPSSATYAVGVNFVP